MTINNKKNNRALVKKQEYELTKIDHAPQLIDKLLKPAKKTAKPNFRKEYQQFLTKGILELINFGTATERAPFYRLIDEISINFFNLRFLEPRINSPIICERKKLTYGTPMVASASLVNYKAGEYKNQEVYFGCFPKITKKNTFIINGTSFNVKNYDIKLFYEKTWQAIKLIAKIAKYRSNLFEWSEMTPSSLITCFPIQFLIKEIFYKSDYQKKLRNLIFDPEDKIVYYSKDAEYVLYEDLVKNIPELNNNENLLNEISTYLFNLGEIIIKKYPKAIPELALQGLVDKYVTYQELLKAMPEIEKNVVLLDEIYNLFTDKGIEVIDVENDLLKL